MVTLESPRARASEPVRDLSVSGSRVSAACRGAAWNRTYLSIGRARSALASAGCQDALGPGQRASWTEARDDPFPLLRTARTSTKLEAGKTEGRPDRDRVHAPTN